MRKARFLILLTLVSLFLFASVIKPTQRVKAGFYIEVYTVVYDCIVSPAPRDPVVGEWTRDCFGLTGWGWEPGHDCTYTTTSYGEECTVE